MTAPPAPPVFDMCVCVRCGVCSRGTHALGGLCVFHPGASNVWLRCFVFFRFHSQSLGAVFNYCREWNARAPLCCNAGLDGTTVLSLCRSQVTKGRYGAQLQRYLYLNPTNKQVCLNFQGCLVNRATVKGDLACSGTRVCCGIACCTHSLHGGYGVALPRLAAKRDVCCGVDDASRGPF